MKTQEAFSSGGGYDVVVNFTGGDTWAKSLKCVKLGGRVLTCGATAGFDPPTDLRFIWTAEMDYADPMVGNAAISMNYFA